MPQPRRRQINPFDELDEEEDGEAALAESESRNIQRQARWQDRLLDNGDPQPAYIIRNVQDKDFACPRLEFIESADAPTLKALALKWAVPYATVSFWRNEQNWDGQRERYWIEEARRTWEASQASLAEYRGRALERVTKGFRTMQDIILQQARLGQKPKFVNGELAFMPFEPKDVQNLSKAYETAARGELAALGLNLVVQKDAADEPEDEAVQPINMMVFNMPATEGEQRRILALPAEAMNQLPSPMGEVIEGEVSPVSTGQQSKEKA